MFNGPFLNELKRLQIDFFHESPNYIVGLQGFNVIFSILIDDNKEMIVMSFTDAIKILDNWKSDSGFYSIISINEKLFVVRFSSGKFDIWLTEKLSKREEYEIVGDVSSMIEAANTWEVLTIILSKFGYILTIRDEKEIHIKNNQAGDLISIASISNRLLVLINGNKITSSGKRICGKLSIELDLEQSVLLLGIPDNNDTIYKLTLDPLGSISVVKQ